jgi:formamidopyrimidine-DNA glycosylase
VPELPEVEVVRVGLATHVVGRTIEDLHVRGARVARRHLAGPDDLVARVRHTRVEEARRRGKYLWLVLATPGGDRSALLLHLGMSGQLLVQPPEAPDERHLHARFGFADDGPELRFVDQRTFGGMALAELDIDDIPDTIGHIAPDPFDPAYDRRAVIARLKARHSAIKRGSARPDCRVRHRQHLCRRGAVAGAGPWRAAVRHAQPKPALGRLLDHAREVMGEALAKGGTSFDALYVNVNGASGYFDRSLAAYGQVGRPCPRCGTLIVREHFMNRSSYFCPQCQPRPRTRA